jgi:hypothetical protein
LTFWPKPVPKWPNCQVCNRNKLKYQDQLALSVSKTEDKLIFTYLEEFGWKLRPFRHFPLTCSVALDFCHFSIGKNQCPVCETRWGRFVFSMLPLTWQKSPLEIVKKAQLKRSIHTQFAGHFGQEATHWLKLADGCSAPDFK